MNNDTEPFAELIKTIKAKEKSGEYEIESFEGEISVFGGYEPQSRLMPPLQERNAATNLYLQFLLDYDLPDLPLEASKDQLKIWCAKCIKQISKGKPKKLLVRIEDSIKNLSIGHSIVQKAAKNKEIYSKRSGTKTNSPYLVYKSEVERKFSDYLI